MTLALRLKALPAETYEPFARDRESFDKLCQGVQAKLTEKQRKDISDPHKVCGDHAALLEEHRLS